MSKISKFLAEEPSDKITAETYLNHLQELVKIELAVKKRQHEEEERPAAIEALQIELNSADEYVQSQMAINPDERPQTDEELKALSKNHKKFLNGSKKN